MNREKSRDLLLEELQNIVGPEDVSDEYEVCMAHARGINMQPLTEDLHNQMRMPGYVVLPTTTEETQKVVLAAAKHKVPLSFESSRCTGMSVPVRAGGIHIDFRKMDKIVEIDEENMRATVEPGVSLAQLQCEAQKRNTYFPVPGGPATISIISQYASGFPGGKARMYSCGYAYRSSIGYEMVLPDGTIFKPGSGADLMVGAEIWQHGPGPDMERLCYNVFGAHGPVTKLTLKLWPLEPIIKTFWVCFEDIDDATAFMEKVVPLEIVPNMHLYSGDKWIGYAVDTKESFDRMLRANPDFGAVITLAGTERQVEYQEKVLRQAAQETNGRIITDALPPYDTFVESHRGMGASFFSEYAMKYWSARGVSWATFVPLYKPEVLSKTWRAYIKGFFEVPEMYDPDFGNAEYWHSTILYPTEGGHYYFGGEHGLQMYTNYDPKSQEVLKKVSNSLVASILREPDLPALGGTFIGTGEMPTGKEMGILGTRFEVAEKFKKAIDPDNIMWPGRTYDY